MARRRRFRTITRYARRAGRRSRGFGLGDMKTGMVGKAAMGLGGAALAGYAVGMFAPQFKDVAKLAGAFYFGGIPGIAAQAFIGGGINLGGIIPTTTDSSASGYI